MKIMFFRRLIALLPLIAVVVVVLWVSRRPLLSDADPVTPETSMDASTAAQIDNWFTDRWKESGVECSAEIDDLQVLRRLTLALFGAIPSLEELRRFEADSGPDKINRWTARMLGDERFAEYFAARLSVCLLGEAGDDFPEYRHDHFVGWLREQLSSRRGFDEIVRQIIAESGFPTSHPAANFLTAEITGGNDYENRLAGRVARVFLGQRIDCAQCHDHPFDDWKQTDFQGLAAFFGPTHFVSSVGVQDESSRRLEVEDRETLETRHVEPRVPFANALLPQTGGPRERLAAWITHKDNRRFPRAVANRIWGLMFGKPFISPVDELPDPPPLDSRQPADLLDLLADDMQSHQFDLRRTIQVIAATRLFRLSSQAAGSADSDEAADARAVPSETSLPATQWIAFPLVHLRPEQILRSMLQASSIQPIAYDPNLIMKPSRYALLRRFLRDYGDLGDSPADEELATIPQTLVTMNGTYSHRFGDANLLSAAGRIAALSRDHGECIDNCFLVCLSRRPSAEEHEYFLAQLENASSRERNLVIEDLFWSLFNSAEFSWNH